MANRWEKPGFEVMTVAGECTAYSGAEGVAPRPAVGRRADGVPAEGPARSGNPPPRAFLQPEATIPAAGSLR